MEQADSKAAAIDQEKVDSEVAGFRELAKAQRQEAIDGLLGLEKQGRLAEDIVTTRKACTALLEVRAADARLALVSASSAAHMCRLAHGVTLQSMHGSLPVSSQRQQPGHRCPLARLRRRLAAVVACCWLALLCCLAAATFAPPLRCRCCTMPATGSSCRSMWSCCPSGAAS